MIELQSRFSLLLLMSCVFKKDSTRSILYFASRNDSDAGYTEVQIKPFDVRCTPVLEQSCTAGREYNFSTG